MREIKGIDIFREGTWHGVRYGKPEIDQLINAFDELREQYKFPVTYLHFSPDAQGWIIRIYKKTIAGISHLFADCMVNEEIVQGIKNGQILSRSIEILTGFKNKLTDKILPLVLKTIAFLGAEMPEVAGLAEITLAAQGLTSIIIEYTEGIMPDTIVKPVAPTAPEAPQATPTDAAEARIIAMQATIDAANADKKALLIRMQALETEYFAARVDADCKSLILEKRPTKAAVDTLKPMLMAMQASPDGYAKMLAFAAEHAARVPVGELVTPSTIPEEPAISVEIAALMGMTQYEANAGAKIESFSLIAKPKSNGGK